MAARGCSSSIGLDDDRLLSSPSLAVVSALSRPSPRQLRHRAVPPPPPPIAPFTLAIEDQATPSPTRTRFTATYSTVPPVVPPLFRFPATSSPRDPGAASTATATATAASRAIGDAVSAPGVAPPCLFPLLCPDQATGAGEQRRSTVSPPRPPQLAGATQAGRVAPLLVLIELLAALDELSPAGIKQANFAAHKDLIVRLTTLGNRCFQKLRNIINQLGKATGTSSSLTKF